MVSIPSVGFDYVYGADVISAAKQIRYRAPGENSLGRGRGDPPPKVSAGSSAHMRAGMACGENAGPGFPEPKRSKIKNAIA